MGTFDESNEMQLLERNIIKSYNELLKTLWEEDDKHRYELMEMHTGRLKEGHEI